MTCDHARDCLACAERAKAMADQLERWRNMCELTAELLRKANEERADAIARLTPAIGGWWCTLCDVFNSDSGGPKTSCRKCRSEKPAHGRKGSTS